MSDWLLGAGSYRSLVKRDMTAADSAAMHSQAGLSGQKLHLSSLISPRKLKDSKSHSRCCYCYRYCRRFLSAACLALRDLHMKQSISSRLTQLRNDSETFYAFLWCHGFHRPCEDWTLDIVMSPRGVYHCWETIKAIFIAAYGCS